RRLAAEVRLDRRDQPLGVVAVDELAPGVAAIAELAGRVAELAADDLVRHEAVVADVPVPQAQLRAFEREPELLGVLAALALGARREDRVRLAAPLASIEAERRAGAEDGEERQVRERLLPPRREQLYGRAARGDDERLVHVQRRRRDLAERGHARFARAADRAEDDPALADAALATERGQDR